MPSKPERTCLRAMVSRHGLRVPTSKQRVGADTRRWRSTNLLERSLGEVRRRTKVIGRFPGEASCLSLCWAVLDLVITHSNGVTFTELDRQAIDRISRERAERSTGEEAIAA